MDSDQLYQIWYGPAKEACSIHVFINHMPGGGSNQWHNLPRWPDGQHHQLKVFFHRSRAGAVEQKAVGFIRWMEDSSDVKSYMWMVDLVQVWVPISSGGDANETTLSASEQPFGVRRLSNGICRYRYDSILYDRKTYPSGGGDLMINTSFATALPRFEHHHHHTYGVQSRWALPLVDLQTGMCTGVVELVTMNDYRLESSQHHGMLTQSFLDSGQMYYEQFCKDMTGTSLESDPNLVQNSSHHLPTQGNMILLDKDNFSWETTNVGYGNAVEDAWIVPNQAVYQMSDFNQFSTQPNTVHSTKNFQIGETSGKDNFSWATTNNVGSWRLENAIEHLFSDVEYGYQNYSANVVDPPIWGGIHEAQNPTQENMVPIHEFTSGVLEQVQVPTPENLGGAANDIIEETSEMVQQLNLEPAAARDNSNTTQRTTSRKEKRLIFDQLKPFSGKTLQEVADLVGVHRSTIKRWCRECAITKWPSSKKRNKTTDEKNMIVKAEYGEINVKVRDFDSTKDFEWLTKVLGVKLKLQVGSFIIQYKDDTGGDPITVSCTQHLMRRLDSLFSANMKTMYLIVSQPN